MMWMWMWLVCLWMRWLLRLLLLCLQLHLQLLLRLIGIADVEFEQRGNMRCGIARGFAGLRLPAVPWLLAQRDS